MVKYHSDSERGNPLLPPHGLLFPINSKGSFICTIPQTGLHIPQHVTPVVEHWLEQEIFLHDCAQVSVLRQIVDFLTNLLKMLSPVKWYQWTLPLQLTRGSTWNGPLSDSKARVAVFYVGNVTGADRHIRIEHLLLLRLLRRRLRSGSFRKEKKSLFDDSLICYVLISFHGRCSTFLSKYIQCTHFNEWMNEWNV